MVLHTGIPRRSTSRSYIGRVTEGKRDRPQSGRREKKEKRARGPQGRECDDAQQPRYSFGHSVSATERESSGTHVSPSSRACASTGPTSSPTAPRETLRKLEKGDPALARAKLRLWIARANAKKHRRDRGNQPRYAPSWRSEITLGRGQTERRPSTVAVDKREAELRSGDAMYGGKNRAEERVEKKRERE